MLFIRNFIPDVVARDGVNVEGPGGSTAPLEADGAQLVVAEEDGRLVDEDETALERVEEAGGRLIRARDGLRLTAGQGLL